MKSSSLALGWPVSGSRACRWMMAAPARAASIERLGDFLRRHRQMRAHGGRVDRARDRAGDDDFACHAASPNRDRRTLVRRPSCAIIFKSYDIKSNIDFRECNMLRKRHCSSERRRGRAGRLGPRLESAAHLHGDRAGGQHHGRRAEAEPEAAHGLQRAAPAGGMPRPQAGGARARASSRSPCRARRCSARAWTCSARSTGFPCCWARRRRSCRATSPSPWPAM